MSCIRGLELLFNLEKQNLKSKEDCIVAVCHCLLINDNFQCAGVGDVWPETFSTTELLPSSWNANPHVYSLRYISKDQISRILLKITKMEHILQLDVALNEDAVESMSIPVADYISDDFSEYSTTYKDLSLLSNSFAKVIMDKLQPKEKKESSSTQTRLKQPAESNSDPVPPKRKPVDLRRERPSGGHPGFPRVGGMDLDPFGGPGGGGMLMDPSSFGVPSRPTLPQFGIGGLPRGAVPPGARFDPFMPPGGISRFQPDPDHMKPPEFEDNFYM